jgi:cytochrome P450
MTDLIDHALGTPAPPPAAPAFMIGVPPQAPKKEAGPPRWDNWKQPQSRFKQAKARFLITPPRFLLWIVRAVPAPRIPLLNWVFVGRYDEVLEVLNRPDVFGVPFSAEVARLNDGLPPTKVPPPDGKLPGTQFLLGEDDRAKHNAQLHEVMSAFSRDDIATLVVPIAADCAAACVNDASPEKFEVMQGLITKVALEICTKYFGVPVGDNPLKFACSVFTVSEHLFGKPPIKPQPDCDKAANYLRYFVDRAIDLAVANPHRRGDVIVDRLVTKYETNGTLGDAKRKQTRAFLMGMIVALIPNNTMAGQHILEVLLKKNLVDVLLMKKKKRQKTRALHDAAVAAWSGDDDRLESVLFEALRFMPLNPGPFRTCKEDYVLAEGTPYEKHIKKGSTVIALLFAAMFDPLRVVEPRKYDPSRAKSDHLHFSAGMHSCVGLMIARAHITQTFKALLQRRCAIKRAPGTRLKMRSAAPVWFEISSKVRTRAPGPDLDPEQELS